MSKMPICKLMSKNVIILLIFTIVSLVKPITMNRTLCATPDYFIQGIFTADSFSPPAPEGFAEVSDPTWKPLYTAKELAEAVFAEASWVFSGIIWGFSFEYTPSDKARKVTESFVLKPRGTITRGSSGLRILETNLERGTLLVNILYYPTTTELSELLAWKQASYKIAQGRAYSPAFPPIIAIQAEDRVQARITAMGEAVKEAIRGYARGITYNKPKIIRGTCSLTEQPSVIITSGQYLAQVKIYLQISEIVSYGSY